MTEPRDQQVLLDLIDKNKGIIFKVCNSYCKNKNDREDLAQEIIYQLWKSAHRFNDDYKFSTWMYRIALNVAISYYRKDQRQETVIAFTEDHHQIEDRSENPALIEDQISLLQKCINELKDLDKALMLLYLESKPYGEIAEILGISETNVATRISRVKEKLKQNFSTINKT